jgi:hypothetical protein
VAAALEAARLDGVDSVILWPSEKSRTLYARHGFVAHGRLMELTLSSS